MTTTAIKSIAKEAVITAVLVVASVAILFDDLWSLIYGG